MTRTLGAAAGFLALTDCNSGGRNQEAAIQKVEAGQAASQPAIAAAATTASHSWHHHNASFRQPCGRCERGAPGHGGGPRAPDLNRQKTKPPTFFAGFLAAMICSRLLSRLSAILMCVGRTEAGWNLRSLLCARARPSNLRSDVVLNKSKAVDVRPAGHAPVEAQGRAQPGPTPT